MSEVTYNYSISERVDADDCGVWECHLEEIRDEDGEWEATARAEFVPDEGYSDEDAAEDCDEVVAEVLAEAGYVSEEDEEDEADALDFDNWDAWDDEECDEYE